jgi:hypothetical protein
VHETGGDGRNGGGQPPSPPRETPRPEQQSNLNDPEKRRASRDEKLDHLPHKEVVIEPESKVCPCCGGEVHVIGEDASKRLDKVPAKVTVIVTRRPTSAPRTGRPSPRSWRRASSTPSIRSPG